MYKKVAEEQAKKQAEAGKAGAGPSKSAKEEKKDENVVDADYKVEDDKKK